MLVGQINILNINGNVKLEKRTFPFYTFADQIPISISMR
jgi:hypothetical protein